jgi:hypothetical protein
VPSAIGAVFRPVAQGKEGILVGDGHEHHVTALAPEAPVRAAPGHVGLAAEADAAIAAVAAPDEYLYLVDEHPQPPDRWRGRAPR